MNYCNENKCTWIDHGDDDITYCIDNIEKLFITNNYIMTIGVVSEITPDQQPSPLYISIHDNE